MAQEVIKVMAIKKYHDEKGLLIGYMIQDQTGATMNVHKDQLKAAVKQGKVEVVNMTLTSDGRLVGSAKPIKKRPVQIKYTLDKVFNTGKYISCALIKIINGSNTVERFICGSEYEKMVKSNAFCNIEKYNDVSSLKECGIKKIPFTQVREKLIKALSCSNCKYSLEVQKADRSLGVKYGYIVSIVKESGFSDEQLSDILISLIENEIRKAQISVVEVPDKNNVVVRSMTGIQDVRKALQGIKKM